MSAGLVVGQSYKQMEKQKEIMKAEYESKKKLLGEFYLTEKDSEAEITFLTEEPIQFYGYRAPQGKGYMCVPVDKKDNPLDSLGNPTYFGAYLVFDHRSYESKAGGKTKTVDGSVRMYIVGVTVMSLLESKHKRYGLEMQKYTVERTGSGKAVSFSFEHEGDSELTIKKLKKYMPESIAEQYDGDVESLYDIIKEQLEMRHEIYMENPSSEKDEDDDEGDEEEKQKQKFRNKNKNRFDRSAKMDDDEDDDEEEDKRPRLGAK